jgi:hypothetical protein
LMISKRDSTVDEDIFLGRSAVLEMESIKLDFVMAINLDLLSLF